MRPYRPAWGQDRPPGGQSQDGSLLCAPSSQAHPLPALRGRRVAPERQERAVTRNSNRNRTSMTLELALRAAESADRALDEGWRCRSTPGADICCRWRCCRVTRCRWPGSGTARSHARRDRNSRAAAPPASPVTRQTPGRAGAAQPRRAGWVTNDVVAPLLSSQDLVGLLGAGRRGLWCRRGRRGRVCGRGRAGARLQRHDRGVAAVTAAAPARSCRSRRAGRPPPGIYGAGAGAATAAAVVTGTGGQGGTGGGSLGAGESRSDTAPGGGNRPTGSAPPWIALLSGLRGWGLDRRVVAGEPVHLEPGHCRGPGAGDLQ
jgi:hypothetical protein